jgi:uncharacterized protein YjlB
VRADTLISEPEVHVEALLLPAGTRFPRHPRLSPLLYRGAFKTRMPDEGAQAIERVFHQNGWRNGWRDTVFDYDHYHSNAHEVLGCYRGSAELQLGGEGGPVCTLSAGDVLLLPAGTAHKKVSARDDFAVVGCYAEGRDYDLLRGENDQERQGAAERIRALPLPEKDPLFGAGGPLMRYVRG